LLPADFVKIAEGCGVRAIRIDDPIHCYEQLRDALNRKEPVLIECTVDPNEPAMETPLPEEHAENYQRALEKTTYQKKELQKHLGENLQHQKQTYPESLNSKSEELMKKMEKES
ncbi:MAG: thiamine pyrophosphate-dependent enzyme, partial [Flavisolibacter sp.]